MLGLAIFPFLIQGTLLALDEYCFHRRRPMRLWERLGHPIDAFFFSFCLAWLLGRAPSEANLYFYCVWTALSCLLITKDEWEHRELCSGFENWLHALLFILHPVALIWAGYMWWTKSHLFFMTVSLACAGSTVLGLYQFFYWKGWRRD